MGSTNMMTNKIYPLVINNTSQLENSSSSSSSNSDEGKLRKDCVQYSSEENVIIVPSSVPVNSPTIKFLLDSLLDEGHIEECLNIVPNSYKLFGGHSDGDGSNKPRALYYPNKSQYRGVIQCNVGRFEAFAWDNINNAEGSRRRAVYIGGYSSEVEAARAHDVISYKMGGPSSRTNFPVKIYWKEIDEMQCIEKREYIQTIRRRKERGFPGSDCDFRGVFRSSGSSRQWQAWLGRDKINLPAILLGTYYSAEDAARAFDIALIGFKGMDAITNFDLTSYDVGGIMARLPNHAAMMSTIPNSVIIETSRDNGEQNLPLQSGNNNNVAAFPLNNVNQHHNNNNFDHHQQRQLLLAPQSPSTPSSSYHHLNLDLIQSSSGGTDLSGLIETSVSPLSNSSSLPYDSCGLVGNGYQQSKLSSMSKFFEDNQNSVGIHNSACNLSGLTEKNFEGYQNNGVIQSSPCDLGGLNGVISHQMNNLSSQPSSSNVNQNSNYFQSNSCNLGGMVRSGYQQGNLLSSSNFLEGNQNSVNIQNSPCNLGGSSRIISKSSTFPSSFQGYQNSNYFQSSSCNLSSSSPSSFEGYENSTNIQSSPYDLAGLNGAISQLNISSPPSSFEAHQNYNSIQRNSGNFGGLADTVFQQNSNLSLPSSSFGGYQNSNSIQSSNSHLGELSGTGAQSSMFGGYQNSSCNLGGLTGTGTQLNSSLASSSSPFLQGSQSSNTSGLTGTGFQLSNPTHSVSPPQGYQSTYPSESRPFNLERVMRTRSQLGLNSSRFKTSPYNYSRLSRSSSLPSTTSPTPQSPQSGPFTHPTNFASAMTSSSSHNTQTGIVSNGALAQNKNSGSVSKPMLLLRSNSQKRSSIFNSQGSQNQIVGTQNPPNLLGFSPTFGSRLLGMGSKSQIFKRPFNWNSQTMVSGTSTGLARAGATNSGVGSLNLNNSNLMINNNDNVNVNVTSPPTPPVLEPAILPLQQQQQQPALVVQNPEEPVNNIANGLNQNANQNLNSSSFSCFNPQSPFPESNSGGGSGVRFRSEMDGNDDDDDIDIAAYLNTANSGEDVSFADVEAWLMMDDDDQNN